MRRGPPSLAAPSWSAGQSREPSLGPCAGAAFPCGVLEGREATAQLTLLQRTREAARAADGAAGRAGAHCLPALRPSVAAGCQDHSGSTRAAACGATGGPSHTLGHGRDFGPRPQPPPQPSWAPDAALPAQAPRTLWGTSHHAAYTSSACTGLHCGGFGEWMTAEKKQNYNQPPPPQSYIRPGTPPRIRRTPAFVLFSKFSLAVKNPSRTTYGLGGLEHAVRRHEAFPHCATIPASAVSSLGAWSTNAPAAAPALSGSLTLRRPARVPSAGSCLFVGCGIRMSLRRPAE